MISLFQLSFYGAILFTVLGALLGLMAVWLPEFWKTETAPKLLITDVILTAASIVVAIITKFLS